MNTDKFNKVYCIDTNIILSDMTNIEVISQKSSNLIIIPETVMDEIDSKKTLTFEEIGFQARSFGRLLEKAEIQSVISKDDCTISRMFINGDKQITIDVISKKKYNFDIKDIDKHILNDRKILDVALESSELYKKDVIFISNDVMCRLRAVSLGIKTEALGKDDDKEIQLYTEIEIDFDLPSAIEIDKLNINKTIFGLCLYNKDGNKKYYYRSGLTFFEIDEEELKRQNIKPQNVEQKIYSSMINDPFYDVIVIDAPAGSGKTLVALSGAMKLIDKNRARFNKIIYMRKTINVDNEEMGFLPGTQEEKLNPYLAPLYSNLEAIISNKYKKKMTKEELEAKITDLIKDYQITPMFEGFIRGTNFRDAVVIIDEVQNESVSAIKSSFTRVVEGCKLIVIGSNRQIDNKYINKHTSALTYLIKRLETDNDDVNIGGMVLTKTVRSRIAEWADKFN